MVPVLSIIFMAVSMIGAIALPLFLLSFYRVRYGSTVRPFIVGCVVFAVMVLFLEGMVNNAIFALFGETLSGNIWLYGLFGGLMAGLFEETGRFLAFKWFVKSDSICDSLTYGAGHGGIEAMIILGLGMLSNIATAVMLNVGGTEALIPSGTDAATAAAVQTSLAALTDTSPFLFLVGLLERAVAIALHVALSVLVFAAVKRGKLWLYPLAIALHAFADFAAVVVNNYSPSVLLTELFIAAITAAVVYLAYRVYKADSERRPAFVPTPIPVGAVDDDEVCDDVCDADASYDTDCEQE